MERGKSWWEKLKVSGAAASPSVYETPPMHGRMADKIFDAAEEAKPDVTIVSIFRRLSFG